jgi:hypothetical protein
MVDQNLHIVDNSADRKNFTIIPNIVDDLPLPPFAVRVYLHLKRVAGDDGLCWQSTETLAKACNMSKPSVTRATNLLVKADLIDKIKKLPPENGQPDREGGKFPHCEYRIRNVWKFNMDFYTREKEDRAKFLDGYARGLAER